MLRLLLDPPASGPWNMAVDEVLLETAASSGQATLRFYRWQEPTLSLGYFQELADRAQHLASAACPVVRRATGGGAILHDRELTYSLAIPQSLSRVAAEHLYEVGHQSLIAALAESNVLTVMHRDRAPCASGGAMTARQNVAAEPFLCFQRRSCFDVLIGDSKICGSAQRRRRGAILQHGSVLMAHSPFAPELPGIEDLATAKIPAAEFIQRWATRLVGVLGLRLAAGHLTESESRRAEALATTRFSQPDRLLRR